MTSHTGGERGRLLIDDPKREATCAQFCISRASARSTTTISREERQSAAEATALARSLAEGFFFFSPPPSAAPAIVLSLMPPLWR
jgi:hypothetical protein